MKRFRVLPFLFLFLAPVLSQVAFADNFSFTQISAIPGDQYWSATTSDTGTVIIASGRTNYLQRSTNSGTSWSTLSTLNTGTYFFASGGGGRIVIAVANTGTTSYRSTDYGATWSVLNVGANTGWRPCMSDDGSKIFVPVNNGTPRMSTDSGTTFSNVAALGVASWMSCAMSANGNSIYVTAQGTYSFKRSSDGGTSWQTTTLTDAYPNDVATSSDGSIVYVSNSSTHYIYKSVDYGATFSVTNPTTTINSANFLATSADGQIVVAFDAGSTIKSSTNGGATWTSETTGGTHNWYAGDLSTDGSKLVAPDGTNGSYVWKSTFLTPTKLTITTGSSSILNFRVFNTITATSNYAGRVTFFANSKKIGGCISVPTNGSLVATCNYKPTIHGPITITARINPTDNTKATISTELFRTSANSRLSNR